MQICGIDHGYHSIKVVTQTKMFNFRSKILPYTDEDINNNLILEYENKKYAIGIGNNTLDIRKTNNAIYRICTMAALAQCIENIEEFKITTALPMIHYKNKEFREQFKEYIAEPNIINVKLNNNKKIIVIKDIIVFMQGASALYAYNPEQYKNNIIAVIDVGGLTINGCIFEDLKPIVDSIFTINAGMLVLYSKIKNTLNEKQCSNIQDYKIPYLINQQEDFIKEIVDTHFEGVIKEMRAKNWSIETLPMLGIGGGILKIKDTINKYLPKIKITNNPIYDNAIGLYNIAKTIFQ